jgi:predicted nucleotidyltransferase
MGIDELLKQHRREILSLATRHGARNVRLFGSVARGQARPDSDVDLLVEMEKRRNLLDLVAFWQDVEDLLGRRVDVVSDGGVNPYLRARILGEAVPL